MAYSFKKFLLIYFLICFFGSLQLFSKNAAKTEATQGKIESTQHLLVIMDADLPLYRKVLSGFALETRYAMHIVVLGQKKR